MWFLHLISLICVGPFSCEQIRRLQLEALAAQQAKDRAELRLKHVLLGGVKVLTFTVCICVHIHVTYLRANVKDDACVCRVRVRVLLCVYVIMMLCSQGM